MLNERQTWVGALGAIGCLVLAAATGCSSAPSTQDAMSDSPTGSSSDAVSGAVGNWTGYTNGQCVAGAYNFFERHFGVSGFKGLCAEGHNVGRCLNCGACELWEGGATEPPVSEFNRYAWGSTRPQTYDMVVYPPAGSATGYGHVAVVDHINSTNPSDYAAMYVMDSNWYGGERMATAVHTVPRVPYGIYRLKSLEHAQDAAPTGYLDSVSCTSIDGWAQDPDAKTTAINTDIYFNAPAGAAGSIGVRTVAGNDRSDLCTTIGSCNHGYSMAMPRALLDGASHAVYAYGIDTAGGNNPVLKDAPKTISCAAPAIAKTSIKRELTSMTVLNDWKFSTFVDMAPYTDAELAAVTDGAEIDAAPSIVQVTGGTDLYVADGRTLRHIANMDSFNAWRFTTDMIKPIAAATFAAADIGVAWPAAPLLVKSATSATIYVLDDADVTAGDGGAPSIPTAIPKQNAEKADAGMPDGFVPAPNDDGLDNGNADSGGSSGCSISQSPTPAKDAGFTIAMFAGLTILARRRRSAKNQN